MTGRPQAFSLVEVTIAIGVIAFALLAVIGLLPIGIQSSKDAGDDTRTSAIAQDVFNRTQGQLDGYVVMTASNNGYIASLPSSVLTAGTFYYDSDGRFLSSSSPLSSTPTVSASGTPLYQAQVTFAPISAATTGTLPGNVDGKVLTAVKVAIGWPVTAAGSTYTIPTLNSSRSIYCFYMRSSLPVPLSTP